MRTNLVRGSECLRPAARGVVRRAARSALRRRTEAGSATTRTNLVRGSEWQSGPRASGLVGVPPATPRTKIVRVVGGPPSI